MRWTLAVLAAIGCGGGGGDNSPEKVCDHMIEVATRDGVVTAADKNPKAKCVEAQQRQKKALGDDAWAKQASCLLSKNDSLSMAYDCDLKKAVTTTDEKAKTEAEPSSTK